LDSLIPNQVCSSLEAIVFAFRF